MVAVVAALVVIAPLTPGFIPARASDVSAPALARAIEQSRTVSWSGDVTTQGTLQIPDTDSFAGVAELFGERKDVRVWWRDPTSWRVDRVRQTGETGLVREGDRLTSWVFESARATVSPYSPVRLPDVSDLLPNQLAERLLSGATDDELSRLPARRIAGRDAPGLRLTPSDQQSTIGQVDVWADSDTGLPLRVEVTGVGADQPVLRSEVDRLDLGTPDPDTTTFTPPPDAEVRSRDAVDLAAGANVFAPRGGRTSRDPPPARPPRAAPGGPATAWDDRAPRSRRTSPAPAPAASAPWSSCPIRWRRGSHRCHLRGRRGSGRRRR